MKSAFTISANDADPEQFLLRWSGGKAFQVTYHFHQATTPETVRLFFSEALPAGRCEVSGDGETWEVLASWEGVPANGEKAVVATSVPLTQPRKVNYLRLSFDAWEQGAFTLVETEIWGAL